MIGKSSGFLETLPPQMRARIEFLRELQDKHDDLFDDYNKELKTLREKFEALYGGQHSIHTPSGATSVPFRPCHQAVHLQPLSSAPPLSEQSCCGMPVSR